MVMGSWMSLWREVGGGGGDLDLFNKLCIVFIECYYIRKNSSEIVEYIEYSIKPSTLLEQHPFNRFFSYVCSLSDINRSQTRDIRRFCL